MKMRVAPWLARGVRCSRHWVAHVAASALVIIPPYATVSSPSVRPLIPVVAYSTRAIATVTTSPLRWPKEGSAAIFVPQLGLTQTNNDYERPIASLTKLMTVYVALRRLPLLPGQSGPCTTVTAAQYAAYQADLVNGLSTITIATGEQLCENQLIEGALVHSGADYADLLAVMAWGSIPVFVNHMNTTAAQLGMDETNYADVVGINPNSQSTALDQAHLAALLMANPVFAYDVDQNTVTLPLAGTLGSYSPYLNHFGIIGVKTGRDATAGGCDVMARVVAYRGQRVLEYTVVLGQGGTDVLLTAANVALALSLSDHVNDMKVRLAKDTTLGYVLFGHSLTAFVLQASLSHDPIWVAYGQLSPLYPTRLVVTAPRSAWAPGVRVGSLIVQLPQGVVRLAVTVKNPVDLPGGSQRLR